MIFKFLHSKKLKHFDSKLEVTNKKIWDLEFLREKMNAMREGFRQDYDRLREQVAAATERLAVEDKKEDPDATIKKNLQNLIDRYTPDIEQLRSQMEGIDGQIEGKDGVNENIEGLRTVQGLLREYMEKIQWDE